MLLLWMANFPVAVGGVFFWRLVQGGRETLPPSDPRWGSVLRHHRIDENLRIVGFSPVKDILAATVDGVLFLHITSQRHRPDPEGDRNQGAR